MPTRFRPCIDLHNGCVKQIVGGTLNDGGAEENFVSTRSSSYYAEMYGADGVSGGHVIMLGPGNENAAMEALKAYPQGMQVGGGITAETARRWLDAGASHVIVTSWIFTSEGELDLGRLEEICRVVGKDRLVLDLSCRKRNGVYYVVTNRWQTFSSLRVDKALETLSSSCSEFLVHGVDVEGKRLGIDDDLVLMLADQSPIPVTYAGGASTLEDLDKVQRLSRGRVDLTLGSALDIFGGNVQYKDVIQWHNRNNNIK